MAQLFLVVDKCIQWNAVGLQCALCTVESRRPCRKRFTTSGLIHPDDGETTPPPMTFRSFPVIRRYRRPRVVVNTALSCFVFDDDDIDDVSFSSSRTFGHDHADRWVLFPASGFLLVSYSNCGTKMHRYELRVCDRQT